MVRKVKVTSPKGSIIKSGKQNAHPSKQIHIQNSSNCLSESLEHTRLEGMLVNSKWRAIGKGFLEEVSLELKEAMERP